MLLISLIFGCIARPAPAAEPALPTLVKPVLVDTGPVADTGLSEASR